jgi:hypothetical protein
MVDYNTTNAGHTTYSCTGLTQLVATIQATNIVVH